jgi:hypothetical protein
MPKKENDGDVKILIRFPGELWNEIVRTRIAHATRENSDLTQNESVLRLIRRGLTLEKGEVK